MRPVGASKVNVMVVGGGGREHALLWKLKQSPRIGRLFAAAKENAGAYQLAERVGIDPMKINDLADFASAHEIGLTIVGPDAVLGEGIVDVFRERRLPIFGPTKAAARLETSKAWAKEQMGYAGIPTAEYKVFNDSQVAKSWLTGHFTNKNRPVVIKADGLAEGKGAYICRTLEEALRVIDQVMVQRVHGDSGGQVVIEEFLEGDEVSVQVYYDGTSYLLCPLCQDHKSVHEGGVGPNTGGMGTVAPVMSSLRPIILRDIVGPILKQMIKAERAFMGCLYPGLMVALDGQVEVLEFNVRFGDPETQVLMRLLYDDLLEILLACANGNLYRLDPKWRPGFAVCVVLASEGYPGRPKIGLPITGIEEAEKVPGVVVFHAGTRMDGNTLVTNGGRVLNITATAPTLREAIDRAYAGVSRINFDGMQYRKDIGIRALALQIV